MAKKELVTIIACPHDAYWASEIEVQLSNFRKFEHSNIQIVVFERPDYIGESTGKEFWKELKEEYKDIATFYFYQNESIKNLLSIYPPISRPVSLYQHFSLYPELKNKVILYLDSDVLFTKKPDFEPYLNDNICYLSKTDYISAEYFSSKVKDIYPHKAKEYSQIDPLNELCSLVGIDKQVVIDNQEVTGGCQYILKNIDAEFWKKVQIDCIALRMRTLDINAHFFPSEEKGFQSWAIGDMCGVLWNLWKRGYKTECPEYLNFTWSSSPIEEYGKNLFFHNAGISGKIMEMNEEKVKMFYKSDPLFRYSKVTFFDIKKWTDISPKYCSIKYLEEILSIKNPICKTKILEY